MADKELIKNVPIVVDLKTYLRAFFPDDKTVIYFRTFSDKDEEDSGRNYQEQLRCSDGLFRYLHKVNIPENRGVFWVVNGGGHNDKAVKKSKSCTAQFMEIDEDENGNRLSFDKQLEIINSFPLKPSIVNRTRKSLHCYWLLKDGNILRFRTIQKKLVAQFHADPANVNESRVMRLPGFFHCKEEPIKVECISFDPELRYTQDELEAVLPDEPPERERKAKSGKMKTDFTLTNEGKIKKGSRRKYVLHIAGLYVNKMYDFADQETVVAAVMQIARRDLDTTEPLASGWDGLESDVRKMVSDFYENKKMERESESRISERTSKFDLTLYKSLLSIKPHLKYKWNDRGNGNLFADAFRKCLRWNTTDEQWMFYNGKVWKPDEGGMRASLLAKKLYDALLAYTANGMVVDDEDIKERYVRHIGHLGERSWRETMIKDARDFYHIDSSLLDADGTLLNCQNGILNLKKRELIAHDPERFQSKICSTSYIPDKRSDLWEWFVADIMYGDVEKIDYLQKLSGYLLLGNSIEEEIYFLNGLTTRNGKTTFIETLAYMLGNSNGYALKIDPKSLGFSRYQNPNAPRGDIARLVGCRLAYTSEPDKQLTLDAGLLKQMSGGNVISARFNHKEIFQFEPDFKLVVDCNNLPLITDNTLFDSGRIRVVTFDKHIPEEKQDKSLKAKLREPDNLSGILNWCLDGLEKYLKDGLVPPPAVVEATNNYRENSDKLGAFISERLEESEQNCSGKDVYKEYQRWCRENNLELEQKGIFFADMRARGLLVARGKVNGQSLHNVIVGYEIAS